jgi:NADP-reducing hydrogenase subunit HndD
MTEKMEMVKLTIDNKQVEVAKGTSIYKAAKIAGVEIPVLCYMDLKDLNIEHKPGGCRVCVVEVEGRRNLAPSCSTDVTDGMVVKTHSIRVLIWRTVMELILSDIPRNVLPALNQNCDLQNMAIKMGIREILMNIAEMSTYKSDSLLQLSGI